MQPLTLKWRADPVVDRCGREPNNLCSLGLVSKCHKGFSTPAFPWRRQTLNFAKHNFVEVQMIRQYGEIAALLPNNFGCGVFDDAWTVQSGLFLCSNEVFKRLADSPHARIPFSCRSKELNNF